ncbi:unnamed protein product [Arctogadus glacialis]
MATGNRKWVLFNPAMNDEDYCARTQERATAMDWDCRENPSTLIRSAPPPLGVGSSPGRRRRPPPGPRVGKKIE